MSGDASSRSPRRRARDEALATTTTTAVVDDDDHPLDEAATGDGRAGASVASSRSSDEAFISSPSPKENSSCTSSSHRSVSHRPSAASVATRRKSHHNNSSSYSTSTSTSGSTGSGKDQENLRATLHDDQSTGPEYPSRATSPAGGGHGHEPREEAKHTGRKAAAKDVRRSRPAASAHETSSHSRATQDAARRRGAPHRDEEEERSTTERGATERGHQRSGGSRTSSSRRRDPSSVSRGAVSPRDQSVQRASARDQSAPRPPAARDQSVTRSSAARDQSARRPSRDQSVQRPPRDQSVRRPSRDQSVQRPSRDQSVQRPSRDQSVQRSSRDQSVQRPSRDQSVQRSSARDQSVQQTSALDLNVQRPSRDQSVQRSSRDQSVQRSSRDQSVQRSSRDQSVQRSSREAAPDTSRDRESRNSKREESRDGRGRESIVAPHRISRDESALRVERDISVRKGRSRDEPTSPRRLSDNRSEDRSSPQRLSSRVSDGAKSPRRKATSSSISDKRGSRRSNEGAAAGSEKHTKRRSAEKSYRDGDERHSGRRTTSGESGKCPDRPSNEGGPRGHSPKKTAIGPECQSEPSSLSVRRPKESKENPSKTQSHHEPSSTPSRRGHTKSEISFNGLSLRAPSLSPEPSEKQNVKLRRPSIQVERSRSRERRRPVLREPSMSSRVNPSRKELNDDSSESDKDDDNGSCGNGIDRKKYSPGQRGRTGRASSALQSRSRDRSRSILRQPSMTSPVKAPEQEAEEDSTDGGDDRDDGSSSSESDACTVIQFDPMQDSNVFHVDQKESTELAVENGGSVHIAKFFDPIGDAQRLMQQDQPQKQAPVFSFLDSDGDDIGEQYISGNKSNDDDDFWGDEAERSKATLRCPSGGEEKASPVNSFHCSSDSSFGQLLYQSGGEDEDEKPLFQAMCSFPTDGRFGATNDCVENAIRKKAVRPKKAKSKKSRSEFPSSLPAKLDFAGEAETAPQRREDRRLKKAPSAMHVDHLIELSNAANSKKLTHPSDSEDSSNKTLDIPLGLNVANNVTAYESEVEQSPKQTPLKKRLGFAKYFRGSSRQPKVLDDAAETSDSEASCGSTASSISRRKAFRLGKGHSLLGSGNSDNDEAC